MAENKPKTLAARMSAVSAGTGRLKKDGHNDYHNYDYVSEANVVETIGALLAENGVLAFPSVMANWQETREIQTDKGPKLDVHTFVILKYRFINTDDAEDVLESQWIGEGQDGQDKGYYKAYTGAQKYALMKTFLIPTGDDPENDKQSPTAQPPQKPADKPAEKPTGGITEPQQKMIRALAENMAIPPTGFNTLKEGWNVQHITEMSKAKASAAITELLEMFLNKVLKLAEQLRIERDELDIMFDRHGLDLTKLDGKALKGVYDELGEIAREVEK
jgi:hypothetical protein